MVVIYQGDNYYWTFACVTRLLTKSLSTVTSPRVYTSIDFNSQRWRVTNCRMTKVTLVNGYILHVLLFLGILFGSEWWHQFRSKWRDPVNLPLLVFPSTDVEPILLKRKIVHSDASISLYKSINLSHNTVDTMSLSSSDTRPSRNPIHYTSIIIFCVPCKFQARNDGFIIIPLCLQQYNSLLFFTCLHHRRWTNKRSSTINWRLVCKQEL